MKRTGYTEGDYMAIIFGKGNQGKDLEQIQKEMQKEYRLHPDYTAELYSMLKF